MWGRVPCSMTELNLAITLRSGQAFRWQELPPGCWTGVFRGLVWTLKQDKDHLYYKVHVNPESPQKEKPEVYSEKQESEKTCNKESILSSYHKDLLIDYFRLKVNLSELYTEWCKKDSYFKSEVSTYSGVRMLRQDPVENLFTFICSSNNNINRITGMVNNLCVHYGKILACVDGVNIHDFPDVKALCGTEVEGKLRSLGFGYRAKYISNTAQLLWKEHGENCENWLLSLREQPYDEVRKELVHFNGVGGKVADCVALMSLDKLETVPVDTHIWQVAARHYMPGLQGKKNLSDSLYKAVGEMFRDKWGMYAGWAQAVLFSSELKHLNDVESLTEGKVVKEKAKKSIKNDSDHKKRKRLKKE